MSADRWIEFECRGCQGVIVTESLEQVERGLCTVCAMKADEAPTIGPDDPEVLRRRRA